MIRSLRMQPNRKLYFKELPMPPTPGPGEVQVKWRSRRSAAMI